MYSIYLSLTYSAEHNALWVHPCGCKWQNFILFNDWVIFHFLWMYVFICMGFPCGSAGKESAFSAGDLGSIPGLGRSPGEANGYPLQCVGLENSMDCIVHGVAKSQTWLSNFHFHKLLLHGVETEVQSSLTICPSSQRRN